MDEEEFAILAERFIGPDYRSLTPKERLMKVVEYVPLDEIQRKTVRRGAEHVPESEADELAYRLMRSYKGIENVAEKLSKR